MNLRRIRHFIALAETTNFSRAADRLHIAQPALSVSIRKLEAELGTKLFERTSFGVVLTPSGKAVLLEAKRLLYYGEQLLRSAQNAAAGTAGRLRIGFVGSSIYGLVPRLVSGFRMRYPAVELVLRDFTSARVLQMLDEGFLDIGIVRTPVFNSHPITLCVLQRDRLIAALAQSHPLAARQQLALADLAGEPFIMYAPSEGPGLHFSILSACKAVGFVPETVQEVAQVPTAIALVESGLGVALVPEGVRGNFEPQVVYRNLQDHPRAGETTLSLAWLTGHESPAGQRFIELARILAPDGSDAL